MALSVITQRMDSGWVAWMEGPEAMGAGDTMEEAVKGVVVDFVSDLIAGMEYGEIYVVDQPEDVVVVVLNQDDIATSGWRTSIHVPRRLTGEERMIAAAEMRTPIEE